MRALALLALLAAAAPAHAQPAYSAAGRARDSTEALAAFRENIATIHRRDRPAYLSHYLQHPRLARTGPGGVQWGYAGLAAGDPDAWPDTLVATHFEVVPLAPGVVYGAYRYRVVQGGSARGVSERVLVRQGDGSWKVAVTTAFASPGDLPVPAYALVGATVVDGTDRPPRPDATVVMRNGRIACVGECEVGDDVHAVDARGKWIVPGLVDAHVHYSQSGWVDGRPDAEDLRARFPYDSTMAHLERNPERFFRSYLCSGVTSTFDVGGYPWTWALRRRAEAEQRRAPPRRRGAAPLHPRPLAQPPRRAAVRPHLLRLGHPRGRADDRAPLLRRGQGVVPGLRHLRRHRGPEGAPAGGGRGGARRRPPAHRARDQPVGGQGRAPRRRPPAGALGGGPRGGRRVPAPGPGGGTPSTPPPSPCTRGTASSPGGGGTRPAWRWSAWTRTPARWRRSPTACSPAKPRRTAGRRCTRAAAITIQANLRRVHAAGIPVAMGTDAGNPLTLHGASIFNEMEAMAAAGLSPMAVLEASTRIAARAMGRDDTGTLEPGKHADLLVLDADPLADVRNLRAIRLVVRGARCGPAAELEYR
jgi:hypothetical protein